MDLTSAIQWLEKLNDLGSATILGLILFGNFTGIWVWGKIHKERISELEEEVTRMEEEKDEWKNMALGLLAPLEKISGKNHRRTS